MDHRIKDIVELTNNKFGLENYHLARYRIYRNVNIFSESKYTLSMEWLPNHISEPGGEELNPQGTSVIDFNITSHRYESVVFVEGVSFANGVSFSKGDKDEVIKWIEQETDLMYGKQFQLVKAEERAFYFEECIDGVPVYPSGPFEMKLDEEGSLTLFAAHGQFPSKEKLQEEAYTLSFDAIEDIAKEHLKLIEFPLDEQEQFLPIFAVEEVFVTNDRASLIPVEIFANERPILEVDQTIYWDEPIHQSFQGEEVSLVGADVTAEQAFSMEPSPDSHPISTAEQEKCSFAVKNFLLQEYLNDSGKWVLKTLYRESGYIYATLRTKEQDQRALKRKVTVIFDSSNFDVLNYIDNQMMFHMFDQFQVPDEVIITKEEAYETLKKYFVYDFEQKQFVLCGKLTCPTGLNACNGEVFTIDKLE